MVVVGAFGGELPMIGISVLAGTRRDTRIQQYVTLPLQLTVGLPKVQVNRLL